MIFESGHFDNYKNLENQENFETCLENSRSFDNKNYVYDHNKPLIFLSHRHAELEDLKGVIGKLQYLGADVYIDSNDKKMTGRTSGKTAELIKVALEKCDKFILLATDKAIKSFWCNWELGLGDKSKYPDHIAILPMKERGVSDKEYKGNEYLQIYPFIDYLEGDNSGVIGHEPKSADYYICKKNEIGEEIKIMLLIKWIND